MRKNKYKKDNHLILQMAFWSGRMDYRRWKKIMMGDPHGHRKVFYESFLHLPAMWLLKEIGRDRFVSLWPEIRGEFGADLPVDRTSLYGWDAVWGMITVGDSQYPITPDTAGLSRKTKEIMNLIIRDPGITAYDIAKRTGRNYSRVHKDIALLIKAGVLRSTNINSSVRKKRLLIPAYSINARLAGF